MGILPSGPSSWPHSNDDEDRVPLHIASQCGDVKGRCADPNARNTHYETPFVPGLEPWAAGVCRTTIESHRRRTSPSTSNGLDFVTCGLPKRTPGRRPTATRYSTTTQTPMHKDKGWRWTALPLASDNGKLEAAQQLLERAADVDARDKYDRTSLHLASRGGHCLTAFPRSRGRRERDIQTSYQMTPLHFAACNGH